MKDIFNLASRFILEPKSSWEIIKDSSEDSKKHLINYILPLSLIPAFAMLIGTGIIGSNVLGYHICSLKTGFTHAIISIISNIAGVFISGIVIHLLAPSFNISVSIDKTVKLVGYSYTAFLISGIFNIIPALSVLTLLGGIYSLYSLYLGFKPMTGVSDDKALSYFISSLIVIILVYILIGVVLGSILLGSAITIY